MAISKEDIYAAIEAINSTGKKPTTITIREYLGTGSLGTINPVLKEWREAQAPPTLPCASPSIPVPQPFIDGVQSMIPQLWTVAAETANTILTTERNAWTAERDELKNDLEELTALEAAANADLEAEQVKNAELTTTIADLKADHAAKLEQEVNARIIAEQDAAALRATNDQMLTRIDDLHDQLTELKATLVSLKADNKAAQAEITGLKATIDTNKADHATALEAQKAARIIAEQNAAVLKATNEQLNTRIEEQRNHADELKSSLTELKEELQENEEYTHRLDELVEYNKTKHAAELAAQTKATHAAEKRAVAAESTAAAQTAQVNELKASIATLRDELKNKKPAKQ